MPKKIVTLTPGKYGHPSVIGSTLVEIVEEDGKERFLVETLDFRECANKFSPATNIDIESMPYQTAVYHVVDRETLPPKLARVEEAIIMPGLYINIAESFLYIRRAENLDDAVIAHDETVGSLIESELILMPPALSLAIKGQH